MAVWVAVSVGSGVGVGVRVGVRVAVRVGEAVRVGVGVPVAVAEALGDGSAVPVSTGGGSEVIDAFAVLASGVSVGARTIPPVAVGEAAAPLESTVTVLKNAT